MYLQDYDEVLPRYYSTPPYYYMVDEVTAPYIKNQQIWVCPSRFTFLHDCGSHPPETQHGLRTQFPISYAYNNFTESYGEVNGISGSQYLGASGRPLAKIKFPAETIVTGDGQCERFWGAPFVNNFNAPSSSYPKHNEGSNFGFIDGHAKWVKGGALRHYMFDTTRLVATY